MIERVIDFQTNLCPPVFPISPKFRKFPVQKWLEQSVLEITPAAAFTKINYRSQNLKHQSSKFLSLKRILLPPSLFFTGQTAQLREGSSPTRTRASAECSAPARASRHRPPHTKKPTQTITEGPAEKHSTSRAPAKKNFTPKSSSTINSSANNVCHRPSCQLEIR